MQIPMNYKPMRQEQKIKILEALTSGYISKVEAKTLLSSQREIFLFKSILHPNGQRDELGDHSLIPLLERAGIEFIHIHRKIIQ